MEFDKKKMKKVDEKLTVDAELVDDAKINDAVNDSQTRIDELEGNIPGALEKVWQDIKDMSSLLKDYALGNYKEVPWSTIASITVAIGYFVLPFDIVPDWIPVIGWLDDAYIIKKCLDMCQSDILSYIAWKSKRGDE